MNNSIPWVEKYRPNVYENIILHKHNKIIFDNILLEGSFPHMLLYGPPGTGKTTTIMNFIKSFLEKHYTYNKELIIHLNASDDRGIDIIRNQINTFVNSKNLFSNGFKFIILDEVDHMTKNAQQALRSFISFPNVRFCLICNYISSIDKNLRNECISIRFHSLPKQSIFNMLEYICKQENKDYTVEWIHEIIRTYKSDIRSMINYIQSCNEITVLLSDEHLQNIIRKSLSQTYPIEDIVDYIDDISSTCMCSIEYIFVCLCKYILKEYKELCVYKEIKTIIHQNNVSDEYRLKYLVYMIRNTFRMFFIV